MRLRIALNNSPYYYYHPRMAKSIGLGMPRTCSVARRLAAVMSRCASDCGDAFIPGIQFGVESDRALQSRSLQATLLRMAREMGLFYVVHIPDLVVPGIYHPSGALSRIASLGYARSKPSRAWFERFMTGRIASAHAIGAKYMVIHLPNGHENEQGSITSYLTDKVTEALEGAGITLCIENCNSAGGPYYSGISEVVGLVRDLGGPYAFCFDYGHYMVCRKASDCAELALAAQEAVMHHVHINDTSRDAHLFLGERPVWADRELLEAVDLRYREQVLTPSAGIAETYVLERNKRYSYGQLLAGVKAVIDALSG